MPMTSAYSKLLAVLLATGMNDVAAVNVANEIDALYLEEKELEILEVRELLDG